MEQKTLSELRPFSPAVSVSINESLEQLVRTVLDHREIHDIYVVEEDGSLLGVINIKSLFRTIFFHHTDPRVMVRDLIKLANSEVAGDIMVKDPVVARETESVDDAIRKMVSHDLGELPLVDVGLRVLGSVSIRTILEAWLQTRGSKGGQGDAA
jgi:CBS-domain-containing membrane protein